MPLVLPVAWLAAVAAVAEPVPLGLAAPLAAAVPVLAVPAVGDGALYEATLGLPRACAPVDGVSECCRCCIAVCWAVCADDFICACAAGVTGTLLTPCAAITVFAGASVAVLVTLLVTFLVTLVTLVTFVTFVTLLTTVVLRTTVRGGT